MNPTAETDSSPVRVAPEQNDGRPLFLTGGHVTSQEGCYWSCLNYSWADGCWSASRQALIFRRLHTQQRSSTGCGPLLGT